MGYSVVFQYLSILVLETVLCLTVTELELLYFQYTGILINGSMQIYNVLWVQLSCNAGNSTMVHEDLVSARVSKSVPQIVYFKILYGDMGEIKLHTSSSMATSAV